MTSASAPLAKPLTYRVENIPPCTSKAELKGFFHGEDQDGISVRSLCPSVDCAEGEDEEYTATILFRPREEGAAGPRPTNDAVSVDRDFYGFTPLYVPPKERGSIVADVIAVTGLAGHAYGSWAHSPDQMWLRDHLPKDAPNVRILTYGYPSKLQGNTSRSILQDHTNTFLHRLLDIREATQITKCQSRPIVFIGHSLGCLLIKKAMIDLRLNHNDPDLPVRTIIFLAAPHRGLDIRALRTLVMGEPTDRLVTELEAESPTLTDLNQRFASIAENVEILTCFETRPTKTAIRVDGLWKREGPPVTMVMPDSAQLFFAKEKRIAVDADHAQISKIQKGEGGIYPNIKASIRSSIKSLPSTATKSASATQHKTLAKSSQDDYHGRISSFAFAMTPDISTGPVEKAAKQEDVTTKLVRGDLPGEGPPVLSHAESSHPRSLTTNSLALDSQEAPALSEVALEGLNIIERREELVNAQTAKYPEKHIPLFQCNKCNAAINHVDFWYRCGKCESESIMLQQDEYNICKSCVANGFRCTKNKQHKLLEFFANKGWALEFVEPGIELDDSAIMKATKLCDTATLEVLAKDRQAVNSRNEFGLSLLHVAAALGLVPSLKVLLDHGAAKEARNSTNWTPLMTAIQYNHCDIVRILLKHGANVNATGGPTLYTPLHCAIISCNPEIVQLILEEKPVVDAPGLSGTPLYKAVHEAQSLESLKLLLDAGANPNFVRVDDKRTPLIGAAASGHVAAVDLLLQHGAIVDARDKKGRTALLWATHNVHLETCKRLLLEKPDIDARGMINSRGELFTALGLATLYRRHDLVELFLKAGADPNIPCGRYEMTCLISVAWKGDDAIARLLLKYGAAVDAKDNKGETALVLAARSGHDRICEILLANKARINVVNEVDGFTALSSAAQAGQYKVVKLLVENGAIGTPAPWKNWKSFSFKDHVSESTKRDILVLVRSVKYAPQPRP